MRTDFSIVSGDILRCSEIPMSSPDSSTNRAQVPTIPMSGFFSRNLSCPVSLSQSQISSSSMKEIYSPLASSTHRFFDQDRSWFSIFLSYWIRSSFFIYVSTISLTRWSVDASSIMISSKFGYSCDRTDSIASARNREPLYVASMTEIRGVPMKAVWDSAYWKYLSGAISLVR